MDREAFNESQRRRYQEQKASIPLAAKKSFDTMSRERRQREAEKRARGPRAGCRDSAPAGPRECAALDVSEAEEEFAFQCRALKLPAPRRQFRFHPERKFQADFAWPEYRLLLEVQGGGFAGGRHTRGAGFREDCERRCLAVGLGYAVLEVVPEQVTKGLAAVWTRVALVARGWQDGNPSCTSRP